MPEYFSRVQWGIHPHNTIPDRECLFADLHISSDDFSELEVSKIVEKLKSKKAAGSDDIAPEFWKYACRNENILSWLTKFCNKIWRSKEIPSQWHSARVAAIFKKGDNSLPENYRPISRLQIGYKVFASLLLSRLKNAGAESRITPTQFGFRSNCGTTDALFIIRRMMEDAWSRKDGSLLLLALDWSRAFDSLAPQGILNCLRRFGVSEHMRSIIANIYSNRNFYVADSLGKSDVHPQEFGISQGCPLSLFLFNIMMTILVHDAKRMLQDELGISLTSDLPIHELLYANDTLLLEVDDRPLWKFME